MVIVTHELFFAKRAADRIVFMDKGIIVEEGPPQQILEFPKFGDWPEISQFIKTLARLRYLT